MSDTVVFLSAYDTTNYKTPNWILRKLHLVFPASSKKNIHTILNKNHLSFVATDEIIITADGKAKVDAHYDNICQGSKFTFEPKDTNNRDGNIMTIIKDSGFYTNLRHAQSVLVDDRYFKVDYTLWLSPILIWINGHIYQVDAGCFMMNSVWFIVFEVIDYKTGKPLTKDDVCSIKGNFNLLLVEKYQFFDEEKPINAGTTISKIIYDIVSNFIWELTKKRFSPKEYVFVHDTMVFSNSIENISDYFCQLIGTKVSDFLIKDISTVDIYEYYPQNGCSVISNYDSNNFNAVLYPAILLEAVKLYFLVFQKSNLEFENDFRKLVRNDMYLQMLFCLPNLPIETHNLLNYVRECESYKKNSDAYRLKIAYLTAQNELKKTRNATILNILLYIISLLGVIAALDVIERHFCLPFKYSFIVVVVIFVLGLIWLIIGYHNNKSI